jgi:hypothetical protein
MFSPRQVLREEEGLDYPAGGRIDQLIDRTHRQYQRQSRIYLATYYVCGVTVGLRGSFIAVHADRTS